MANDTPHGFFPTTQWTLIARVKGGDTEVARRALNDLCTQYHYPLYCYIRRRGFSHHDAQDALHDFISKILRLGMLESAEMTKGHLRSFLSTALGRYLMNWHRDRPHRQREVSTDAEPPLTDSEDRYERENFTDNETPDLIFERKWAVEMIGHAIRRLGEDYATRGKGALYASLEPVLRRGGSLRGEDAGTIASGLGMQEAALRMAHSRLLHDFRGALESEVRETVENDSDIAQEIARLRNIFTAS